MPEPLIYPLPPTFPAAPDVPLYRWGTVTQASPLRVRLDGDDTPLLSDPWDMAGPRTAGERVYVQISGRRVVLLGPNSKPGTPVDLSSYLNTSIWEAYNADRPAIEAVRWGPWVMISGELKCKSTHPWIGLTPPGPTGNQLIASGIPDAFRMRPHGGNIASDAAFNRSQMTGSSSWYVVSRQVGGELQGGRVNMADGSSAITNAGSGTWFPFSVSGWALDAF